VRRLLSQAQTCYRSHGKYDGFLYFPLCLLPLNLTPARTVNQVESIPGTRSRGGRYLLALALPAWLLGCDPSPASRAVQQAPPALSGPVAEPTPVPADPPPAPPADPPAAEAPPVAGSGTAPGDVEPPPSAEDGPATGADGFALLGESVPPGSSRRLIWSATEVFEGVSTETPVLVVNGTQPGPTLCLTAAIHGDELNGIEMVRRVIHDLDPDELRGTVIGIPIVNLQGFRRGSRYLPDRRDLNRYFPGNPDGSSASRIAHSLFEQVIRRCDSLVDLHTGSFYRTNLPQLRADLRYRKVRRMTEGFGGMVVLHSEAAEGTLRRAATDAGIPAVTVEAGEPQRLQPSKVSQGVTGIFALLGAQEMIRRVQLLGQPEPVFYESNWIRADHGGILFSVVRLGQVVEAGDVLGTVTDPITNEQNLIYSTSPGRVLGMALNQVVMPGFAAFRIGMETDGPPSDSVLAAIEWGRTEAGDADVDAPDGTGDEVAPETEESDTAALDDGQDPS